jgi:hypothetical protein
MAYAGENYGPGGAYTGQAANSINPVTPNGLGTPQAAAAIVLGSLIGLIMIRRGFRGLSVSRATGGLVKG